MTYLDIIRFFFVILFGVYSTNKSFGFPAREYNTTYNNY